MSPLRGLRKSASSLWRLRARYPPPRAVLRLPGDMHMSPLRGLRKSASSLWRLRARYPPPRAVLRLAGDMHMSPLRGLHKNAKFPPDGGLCVLWRACRGN